MNDHFDDIIEGESILWPDASLEGVETAYEDFTIRVREETGGRKIVRCFGYVGFQLVGFWDEIIIESARFYTNHSFIEDCERRLNSLPATGAKARTASGNRLLEITLIDDCKLWVCAPRFRCEQYS